MYTKKEKLTINKCELDKISPSTCKFQSDNLLLELKIYTCETDNECTYRTKCEIVPIKTNVTRGNKCLKK